MEIIFLVAVDKNLAIGIDGDQPAYISGDLIRFKGLTTGNAIVMGRKTFQSLPKGALPNRRNIVLTRDENLSFENCEMARTIEDVYELAKDEKKLFIIGGGEIYKLFMDKADKLLITKILHTFHNVDTWFPEISEDEWEIASESEVFLDEKSNYSYMYVEYIRKK